MPKFYINDGFEQVIIDAEDPLDACVKSLKTEKLSSVMLNGFYNVSEKGFDSKGQIYVDSNVVLDLYAQWFEKRHKGEDCE